MITSLRRWFNSLLKTNTLPVNNQFTKPLIRRDDELYSYRRWKNTNRHHQTLLFLLQKYYYTAHRIIHPDYLYTWNSQASNGFYIQPCEHINEDELYFLFEWFHEKILSLPYYIYTAEKQYRKHQNQIFQTDFIYFKPSINILESAPWNQQFGNIELHLYYKSREPIALKLMAHVYSDSNYTKPQPFEHLLEYILH